ncbi:MAG TPA: glycosyltransferase family 4 protein [Tepidisphaeraceae bacterium]
MIYLDLPVGDNFGWGVCGKYVAREMANLTPVCLITENLTPQVVTDEFEFARLRQLLPVDQATVDELLRNPLLQAIGGSDLRPIHPQMRGTRTVGYTFFEDSIISSEALAAGRQFYEVVATGSSWCTKVLQEHKLPNVATVIQGIDPNIFFPHEPARKIFGDRFVVFSGGKFEHRKGQDIVLRAFKVLQDRHADVLLVTAWFNQWGFSWQTMRNSPHIRFAPRSNNYFEALAQIYADNGIDINRTINLAPRSNQTFANIYRNTDVGMFPNRCEGGTNLVLMEYMACGRPVIATDSTGHSDVVSKENALVILSPTTTPIRDQQGAHVADWPEPNLEQAIELLEQAYQNRDALKPLAQRAAEMMSGLTWRKTAEGFLKLLTP